MTSKNKHLARTDRANDAMRDARFSFELGHHADGYCVARSGRTTVLCTARLGNRLPPHMRGTGSGWLTAEYAMLPNATNSRISRTKSIEGGRSKEISRLIGRALRSVCRLDFLGERQVLIDCDVLHADGGTRVTAINGSFIALYRALSKLHLAESVLRTSVSAVSCILLGSQTRLDPDYTEDSNADADANFVFSGNGGLIEAQLTAEDSPIAPELLTEMTALCQNRCQDIARLQAEALGLPRNHFTARV